MMLRALYPFHALRAVLLRGTFLGAHLPVVHGGESEAERTVTGARLGGGQGRFT